MPMSNYLRNKVLDHVNGKAAYTMPTTVYVAALTSASSVSGPGTEVSTAGTGYARQAITATMNGTRALRWNTVTPTAMK